MKKKLLSFVIAAAMVMGIPAALGSAGLNMPDDSECKDNDKFDRIDKKQLN